jgi:transposase-like protein
VTAHLDVAAPAVPRSPVQNFQALTEYRDAGLRLRIPQVLAEIHQHRQWEDLGYATFEEACDGYLGGWRLAFPPAERREVVADLTGQGMSTRAIASTLGVSKDTVQRDQTKAGVSGETPAEVRGNDGKTYTRTTTITDPAPPADPYAGWSRDELDALEDVRAGRSVVVNMQTGAVLGPRLWAWAQANGHAVRIDRRTEWGNPFEIPGDGDRATVIANYAEHYLPNKPSLLAALPELRGKVLGCWCAPLACHGHALLAEVSRWPS